MEDKQKQLKIMAQSIFSQLLAELQTNKNHNASIERCKAIIKDLENSLNKRVVAYFSSEVGNDAASMVNDSEAEAVSFAQRNFAQSLE